MTTILESIPKSFSVSVILPTYNERENVTRVIRKVSRCLGDRLLEMIVVDDNSPDGTWKVVQKIENPKCKLIRRINQRNLASAISRGVNESKGNVIVWTDCDLGVPPKIIPKLVVRLRNSDVAVASRYVDEGKDLRPRSRAFVSLLVNKFANLVLGFDIKDYTSGIVAVRRNVLKKVKLSSGVFGEYFIEFLHDCIKNNYKVIEIGYIYRARDRGISKSDENIFTLIKYGLIYTFRIVKQVL